MVNGARAFPCNRGIGLHSDMKFSRNTAFAHAVNVDVACCDARVTKVACQAHSQKLAQDHICLLQLWNAERNGAKTSDLIGLRHRAARPENACTAPLVIQQREALAFRILKIDCRAVVAQDNARMGNLVLLKPIDPPAKRIDTRDTQGSANNRPGSSTGLCNRPFKECDITARCRLAVGVKEMVGGGIILIDGFLDKPHAQNLGVKAKISRSICRDRR